LHLKGAKVVTGAQQTGVKLAPRVIVVVPVLSIRRADAYAKLRSRLVARHASSLNRGNHALTKIH
jgi:hypothetical protein